MLKRNLLIIEDDLQILNSLAEFLITKNFNITKASTYTEFKSIFSNNKNFDVILCDIQLQDKDGIKILNEIKKGKEDIVVIMITDYTSIEITIQSLQEGANDFIIKPFKSLDNVLQVIEWAFEKQKLTLENIDLYKINELKDELIALISHEFRTPITIIKGYMELISEKINEHPYFAEIEKQFNKLIHLIDQITLIAEIKYKKINIREFQVDELLQEVELKLIDKIEKKNIELVKNIKQPILKADKELIKIVIENLLDNAIKFSSGGNKIGLNILPINNRTKIEIRDYGKGIDKKNTELIFEKFKQAENFMTRRTEGMGLGLYIVKSILDLHSTKIEIESEVNKGSAFYFFL